MYTLTTTVTSWLPTTSSDVHSLPPPPASSGGAMRYVCRMRWGRGGRARPTGLRACVSEPGGVGGFSGEAAMAAAGGVEVVNLAAAAERVRKKKGGVDSGRRTDAFTGDIEMKDEWAKWKEQKGVMPEAAFQFGVKL
ncbi:RED family protein [Perilla frutescens var. frutescens]|nr:RED family protein [Perilla frutescens var. frutescens]